MTTDSYLARRAMYLFLQTEGRSDCKTETAQQARVKKTGAGSPGVDKNRFHDERPTLEETKQDTETDVT